MSKVLTATCAGGVVTAEGVPVPQTKVLSEGVAQSEGVLVIDEGEKYYLAKTSPDLKTTLDRLSDALGQISSALGALNSAGFLIEATAGVPSPPLPGVLSNISSINAAKSAIDALKGALK